jgi:hypothetical protein
VLTDKVSNPIQELHPIPHRRLSQEMPAKKMHVVRNANVIPSSGPQGAAFLGDNQNLAGTDCARQVSSTVESTEEIGNERGLARFPKSHQQRDLSYG